MLELGVRSKCCEAPVRMGYKKNLKTKEKTVIWICCHCKKRDVDLWEFRDGKVIHDRSFAAEEDDEPTDNTDLTD